MLFTTSPDKAQDAKRLGADEVVVSKHLNSFDFILNTVAAPLRSEILRRFAPQDDTGELVTLSGAKGLLRILPHNLDAYLELLKRDGTRRLP